MRTLFTSLCISAAMLFVIPAIAQDGKTSKYDDEKYIPVDIEDAVQFLDYQWADSLKTYVADSLDYTQFIGMTHFSTGLYMRNNWGLWNGDSELFRYFTSHKIYQPDDMSGVILDAFFRYLKQEDMNIEELLTEYKSKAGSVRVRKARLKKAKSQ